MTVVASDSFKVNEKRPLPSTRKWDYFSLYILFSTMCLFYHEPILFFIIKTAKNGHSPALNPLISVLSEKPDPTAWCAGPSLPALLPPTIMLTCARTPFCSLCLWVHSCFSRCWGSLPWGVVFSLVILSHLVFFLLSTFYISL